MIQFILLLESFVLFLIQCGKHGLPFNLFSFFKMFQISRWLLEILLSVIRTIFGALNWRNSRRQNRKVLKFIEDVLKSLFNLIFVDKTYMKYTWWPVSISWFLINFQVVKTHYFSDNLCSNPESSGVGRGGQSS